MTNRASHALQGDFVAIVGHEIRNLLHVILTSVEVAHRTEQLEVFRVERILRQSRQLERLIADLLDGYQIDSGQLRLRRGRSDLIAVLRACVEEAAGLSPAHDIFVDAPDGRLDGVWDTDRLAQVIRNLLSNAIKYSPRGGRVLVKLEASDRLVEVSIIDHGVGIPPDALPRVFDRFYRAPGTAGHVRGMGVGLHLCKQLIEAHGGTISVASQPDRGTTIRFQLPRDGTPQSAQASYGGRR